MNHELLAGMLIHHPAPADTPQAQAQRAEIAKRNAKHLFEHLNDIQNLLAQPRAKIHPSFNLWQGEATFINQEANNIQNNVPGPIQLRDLSVSAANLSNKIAREAGVCVQY